MVLKKRGRCIGEREDEERVDGGFIHRSNKKKAESGLELDGGCLKTCRIQEISQDYSGACIKVININYNEYE